jgi:signal transduction histidine kinase
MIRILFLVIMHAVGDFLLQGSTLSKLKASKIAYLFAHVGIYTAFFIALSPLLLKMTFMQGLTFSLVNGAAHFVIDFATGKFKQKFWEKNEAAYIATISFDHILHLVILIATYMYMFPSVMESILK